ncbi:MAG: hypothetical protein U9O24_07655 [Campylobacterota bacterium]|nr:hypothetical protein [Campylobacterota bacterium]
MNDLEKRKFQIHYYFDDDSHSMNAFVRNKAEKDFLDAIRQIGSVIDSELNVETLAYEEGGLKEYILIGFLGTVGFLAPSINDVITHYVTKDAEDRELDKKIKRETLKSLELDNTKKEQVLDEEISSKLDDKQTIRYISNFYTQINNYEKIQKIGFKDIENDNEEYIVERKYFKNFILEDTKDIIEDENAMIEIISPILKEGKFKWKGLYNGDKIDFSMGDYNFKKEVIEGKHTFSNGSFIECRLQITITYDDFGDEKRRNYSVKEIFGIQELSQGTIILTKSGKKKKRNERQGSLFDLDKE